MDEAKGKFQFAGLRFLYDMELVDDPQLINNMKLNIFDVSSSIRDAEFLSSYHHKSMLIYIDLNWIGRTFLEKRIVSGVTDRVQQLLPKFRFRVTTDRRIFDLAVAKVKAVLKGETYEEVPRTAARIVDAAPSPAKGAAEATSSPAKTKSDPSGDPETQS